MYGPLKLAILTFFTRTLSEHSKMESIKSVAGIYSLKGIVLHLFHAGSVNVKMLNNCIPQQNQEKCPVYRCVQKM